MRLFLIRISSCHNEYFNIPSLTDNAVDGESFLDLSESDLKEMIPNKMGVVKRILKLQQEVSYRQARRHNHTWQQSVSNYCTVIRCCKLHCSPKLLSRFTVLFCYISEVFVSI